MMMANKGSISKINEFFREYAGHFFLVVQLPEQLLQALDLTPVRLLVRDRAQASEDVVSVYFLLGLHADLTHGVDAVLAPGDADGLAATKALPFVDCWLSQGAAEGRFFLDSWFAWESIVFLEVTAKHLLFRFGGLPDLLDHILDVFLELEIGSLLLVLAEGRFVVLL
jgi:hypothetical protein